VIVAGGLAITRATSARTRGGDWEVGLTTPPLAADSDEGEPVASEEAEPPPPEPESMTMPPDLPPPVDVAPVAELPPADLASAEDSLPEALPDFGPPISDPRQLVPPRRPPAPSAAPVSVAVGGNEARAPASPRVPLRPTDTPDPPLFPGLPLGATVVLVLEYTISADGRVVEAVVTASSGFPALDASTREFVLARWRYEPPGSQRRVVRRFVFTRRL
jgi:TonB family protein